MEKDRGEAGESVFESSSIDGVRKVAATSLNACLFDQELVKIEQLAARNRAMPTSAPFPSGSGTFLESASTRIGVCDELLDATFTLRRHEIASRVYRYALQVSTFPCLIATDLFPPHFCTANEIASSFFPLFDG